LNQEDTGHPCVANTVWGTVYVPRDDELLENAVKFGRGRTCRTAWVRVVRLEEGDWAVRLEDGCPNEVCVTPHRPPHACGRHRRPGSQRGATS
jgi:hypothetical protein